MKNFNNDTQFVCTAMDNCLYYPMYGDEVIENYFKDPNTSEDVFFCGKNMKELFEESINNESMYANDWQDLQTYMHTINLRTWEEYIMNFFEIFELDKENEEYCSISERAFLNTINHSSQKYNELVDGGDTLPFDIAALLAQYAANKFGGVWASFWTEGRFEAYNTVYCEIRNGDVFSKNK